MFYFVGNTLTSQITGIESAQIKRLRLFAEFHEPAKYISCGKTMDRTANAKKFGMTAANYVNLIDFLCQIPFDYQKPLTPADLGFDRQYRVSFESKTEVRYSDAKHLFAAVHCEALTKQVTKVYYYDFANRGRVLDLYDPRGFASIRYFYDENLHVVNKAYLDLAGKVRLRVLYTNAPERQVAGMEVFDEAGRMQLLTGENALRRYFFDQLNQTTTKNIFICDRTRQNAWALEHMQTRAFKLFHMHNVHASDLMKNPGSTDWNFNYRQPLNNLDQWQGAIVLTDQQMADITLSLPKEKFVKVPAVVIPPERLNAPRVKRFARTPGKIIAVARIDRQKKLKELVQVVKLMHDQQPNITLDIWGLTQDKDYEKEVLDLIAELKLTQVVTLRGFAKDINTAYDQAQLMILTSRVEGTILALAEAQSHGVPVVSYDFKYGPQEFIKPGVNGEIVPVNARHQAAKIGLKLLGDAQLWQRYSDGCYDESPRYCADKVFAYWQKLKAKAEKFYQGQ